MGLQQMLDAFRRALVAYDSGVDTNAAEAARRFGEEIDRLVEGLRFARTVQSSVAKGMSAREFFDR
jgi:hypothetical protein